MALFRELEAQAPPPRQRAPRRRTPKPEQLAILSPEEQERRERRAAQRQAYDKRRQCRPDGQPLPKGMSWCGRCGETVFAYSMVINHDLGYCGCPVEFDPVLKLKNGPGFRHGTPFNRDELNDRWDRQFFADCVCGDACGIHQPDGWCYAYCGCDEYRPSDV
jgi:hypothetical protein